MSADSVNIVADIGGTNLRIAITSDSGEISGLSVYQCHQYPSLEEIILDFIDKQELQGKAINACLAIACPVDNDLIVMTNLPWQFTKSSLRSTLGLNKLVMINDYTAIAHAIPQLKDDQKVQVGEGTPVDGRPISICGPGTGLGVGHLVKDGDKWMSISCEGGHVDFAPIDEQETEIFRYLLTKYSHVSYEQWLSGLGLEQIYQALVHLNGGDFPTLEAKDITTKALSNECAICEETLAQFCRTLGSFAGNLGLTLGSFGGVYIAGGIVPRFIDYFKNSEFRKRFDEKGRLSGFNQKIPTYVITESQPGILGASAYLLQHNLLQDG
jgi:glucokinase